MTVSTQGMKVNWGSRSLRASVELLSSMRFSISLLTVICIASIIGTVLKQEHFEGDHRLAFSDAAHTNERMEWRIDTAYGELEMTQFSGAAARRIVPYVGPGATLRRGDRIGLIRFGSRTDVLTLAMVDMRLEMLSSHESHVFQSAS